ncbi:enoyl-CoA hydratase [Sabulicella glaciei]|uniref:Enoyl-CoA hydratase domain-containing protein 3, mitochondrial n=1 Tax=Sabulicella glaciei TaxID=2984948 RepID=A0ABT3NXL4_9PROT|nr:enoyl-CoA hydratase [Roseococcus sp. MDT2-1-1]MCW8086913.1 enoyl-CoA hydratase [Roseococcus sp. MDT2-1-1]
MIRAERRNDGVALLVLDRPAQRNALSLPMLEALRAALREAEDARCIVLAAEGPAFCAGHDMRELTEARSRPDGGREFFARTMALCGEVMRAVTEHPVPVIAAVEGIATAAGCQLVAACDMGIAAPGAKFCTPGVEIGLFCSTPAVALSRAVSRKAALEMLFTGRFVSAEEAARLGLVNRVEADPRIAALEMASRIVGRSGVAIRMGKAGFNRQCGLDLAAAYEAAATVMVENMMAADAEEGIGAFLGKRAPNWTDR